jgi:tetratricopeptide (TPR) repeat protein
MNPADPNLQDDDLRRRLFRLEPFGDGDAEPVVAAQDVPDPGDDHSHVDEDTDMIDELEERLARYPAARYPVQHATAQFHLGVALTNARQPGEGRRALERAVELFEQAAMPLEHAKALNALGAALREAGDAEAAARAFADAAEAFERAGSPLEEGAARFNLGLVRRDREALSGARELLDPAAAPAQAAAAARELGVVLLEAGSADEAASALADAVALAEAAGDEAGRGAAANMLGLARLAAGRAAEAVEAFRLAAAANPRSVRPAEFAMAKANLALAYERAHDAPRARLAARQALGVPAAPTPVVRQAEEVVGRLGPVGEDLGLVLDAEPEERRPAVVREEVVRWSDAAPMQRTVDAALWIRAQRARPELAEPWLAALLELPSSAMEDVIRSTLEGLSRCASAEVAQFRADVVAAMARFHLPQLERLRVTFARISRELGEADTWS